MLSKIGDKEALYAIIRSKHIPVQRLMIPPNQSAQILISFNEKVTPDHLELMEFYRSQAEGVPINKISLYLSLYFLIATIAKNTVLLDLITGKPKVTLKKEENNKKIRVLIVGMI
ncbi:hypothetical protein E1B06_19740 [Brevibacillus laterosporus]|uniref:hypothetical protein n=1 Tax=Brevibacillus laterosporus TaxID=1465 RepID=UPI0024067711|nr:hypothetical protein [Brevibacillus laterosporus]MDF9413888.1 hypothetical protein [Brevibacillus laterosporus]